MNKRRHWGGASHGVGQPDEQRNLCRLANGADKQHQRNERRCGFRESRRQRKELGIGDGAKGKKRHEDCDHEAPVANAIGNERLLAGAGVFILFKPERNEEVRASAHAFPAQERKHQVVAENEDEHRENEQVQVREKTRETTVSMHVPN